VLPDSLANLLIENRKQDPNRMQALNTIIDVLFDEMDYDHAYPYINELGTLAEKLNDEYYKALSNYYLGSCLCVKDDYKNGFIKLNEAQHAAELLPDGDMKYLLKIRINLALSACYVQCNMLSDAFNQLQQGLALNELHGTEKLQIKLENNLAAVYSKIDKLDASNAIYKKLLNNNKLFNKGELYCNYNIANNFISLSEPDSALKYLIIAQHNIESEQDNLLVMKKIGDVYRLQDNLDSSKYYYNKVLQLLDKDGNNNPSITSSTTLELAKIYNSSHNYDAAIVYSDKSIAASKACYDLENESNALKIKIDALEKSGNINAAYSALKESITIQDSLYSIRNVDKLNELMLQQEIIGIDKEYKHKQSMAALQQSKERMLYLAVIAILIGTVLVVMLLWNRKRILLINKQIKEDALANELDSRNRELASNVITLMKKNETYTEVINKLLTIKENAVKDETKNDIDRVTKEIEKTMEGKLLEDFEVRFKQVHGDFYERLTQKYPDLSNNEIRLCSFLKLNLTTKEISSLTGQSASSILKARYRLRKKMNINDDSINLSNYIMSI